MSDEQPWKAGYRYHVHMDKVYVLRVIVNDGAAEILKDWEGTDDEALLRIAEDPRRFFAFGCDNEGPLGKCQGHRIEKPALSPRP